MRLIDADELIVIGFDDEDSRTFDFVPKEFIDQAPTIEAEPIKHGRWILKGEDGDSRFMCSVCCSKEYVPTCNGEPTIWNYCPYCGADMRETEEVTE